MIRVLRLFLRMSLVGLYSVCLPQDIIGWTVFCVSFSGCHWLICALFNLLRMSLVGLCSVIVAFPRSSTFVCVVVVCLF